MTQKEINKFLTNTKVYVNGKSKEIQEKLFLLGWSWSHISLKEGCNTTMPFLFISEKKKLYCSANMEYFSNHTYREIPVEEILSIELTKSSYRPFKSKEECWNEMKKHQPFGWVSSKNGEATAFVYYISTNYMRVNDGYSIYGWTFNYEEMFDKYVFADGTPFGIKEE